MALTTLIGYESRTEYRFNKRTWKEMIALIKQWQSIRIQRRLTIVFGKSIDNLNESQVRELEQFNDNPHVKFIRENC